MEQPPAEIINDAGLAWMDHMRAGAFDPAWEISDRLLRERASTPSEHLPRQYQWIWKGQHWTVHGS